jgi:hypothetical protein
MNYLDIECLLPGACLMSYSRHDLAADVLSIAERHLEEPIVFLNSWSVYTDQEDFTLVFLHSVLVIEHPSISNP